MLRNLAKSILAAATLAMILTGGCGGSKPARFYLLESGPGEPASTNSGDVKDAIVIGIEPLTLPDYLQRSQIATRVGDNQWEYAEFDRWAEPLVDNLTRVVNDGLSSAIPEVEFLEYPWPAKIPLAYRVVVDIRRFDLHADGSAVLAAYWAIGARRNGEWIKYGEVNLTETFQEDKKPDYPARVAALDRLVAGLNRELAAGLRAVVAPGESKSGG